MLVMDDEEREMSHAGLVQWPRGLGLGNARLRLLVDWMDGAMFALVILREVFTIGGVLERRHDHAICACGGPRHDPVVTGRFEPPVLPAVLTKHHLVGLRACCPD